MDDLLGLVQLFLNLGDAVPICGVLVFCDVVLELGHCECLALDQVGVGGARISVGECVNHLAGEGLGDAVWVFSVGSYDATDACLLVPPRVKYVFWLCATNQRLRLRRPWRGSLPLGSFSSLQGTTCLVSGEVSLAVSVAPKAICQFYQLLAMYAGASMCTHKLSDGISLEIVNRQELRLADELYTRIFLVVPEDSNIHNLHGGGYSTNSGRGKERLQISRSESCGERGAW